MTLRRLAMLDGPSTVVLGGGVLTGAGRRLLPDVHRRCAEVAPEVAVRIADVPPVVGAGLLGLDRLGADQRALRRLAQRA